MANVMVMALGPMHQVPCTTVPGKMVSDMVSASTPSQTEPHIPANGQMAFKMAKAYGYTQMDQSMTEAGKME